VVDALRVAGLRATGALRVVVRAALFGVAAFARRVVDAARLVPREEVPLAICCTCLLKVSRRFSTLSTSACFARLRTWACSWSIAAFSVFWPSLTVRSS
jgi:hypothetical protein